MKTFRIFTRAIILNEKNEILLTKKSENQKYGAGQIILPGGTLEFGEDLEDYLKGTLGLNLLFGEVENTKNLKNMEPKKHEFVKFLNFLDIKEEFLDKNIILDFHKNSLD